MNTKKYKKRKRRFQKFTLAILLFLTVFWLAPKIISTASDIVYTVFNSSSDLTTKYKAATPMKLNDHEVKNKLYSLSQKYPEFKTIYKNISDYPKSLLFSLCNTPEMIDFVKGYPNADNKPHGNITEKELSEGEKNAEIVNTEPKKELSDEDKAKVADLKKQAAENLTKYLEMNPNGEDKQTVEELIKEINSYSEESSAKVEE